ncbi:MAG: ABC transporter ATP-binding protein [Tissierellia bacterium]|nr:ABC transporter ATP-binding protein [Tissierellia bacterium]
MKLILRHLKNYKALLLLNIASVLGFVIVELSIPTITAMMIDVGIRNSDKAYTITWGWILIAIAIFGGLSSLLLNYCSVKIATNVTRDIRNSLFSKVQSMSHADFQSFGVSSLITRTTSDPWQLQLFVQMLLRVAFLAPLMIVSSITLILKTSVELSMIMFYSIPVIIIAVALVAYFSGPISKKQQKLLDRLNQIIRENITGVRVIRAFRKDEYENERFEEINKGYKKFSSMLFRLMSLAEPVFFFFLNCILILIAWVAAQMIGQGTLEVGQLVAFTEYQFHAMFSVMLFASVFVMYPRAAVSASRIQEVLDVVPSIKNPAVTTSPIKEEVSVEFDNVSFSYPDGEENILKHLSFKANKGETVAFIGSTGSGKSTLAKLIVRFYDVTEGQILVNGVDVRDHDLQELRQSIGFVPQKANLFSGTIDYNIRFGKENATEEEVIRSSKIAEASSFIQAKPNKYEDIVSEGGLNLSGGQKQRLSISRAVIRDANIFVFDDSFSALDYKTDAMVRANLKNEMSDSIVLVVAQRISSIMNADKIIVLNEGKMVGMGTHGELMKTCTIYQEIAHSQLSEGELSQYGKN